MAALERMVLIGQQCPDCRRTLALDRRSGKTLEEAAEEYVAGNNCRTCIAPESPAAAPDPSRDSDGAGTQPKARRPKAVE